jgi:hypothetical protein
MVIESNTTMTNSDFLAEVYGQLEPGTHGWVASFRADPSDADPGVWAGRPYKGLPQQAALIDKAAQDNTYFCTAVLTATGDGEIVRRKDAFVRLAVLVLDDVQLGDVQGYSYAIQTSPGKFQIGIFLDGEDTDAQNKPLIDRIMSALAARGRSNDASGNACVRYVRLPIGSNTKPRAAGTWQVQLEAWQPNVRWSLEDACAAVGLDLDAMRAAAPAPKTSAHMATGNHAGELVADLTNPDPTQRVYHDSIIKLAANLVAGGMFPGAAVEHLYSLMDMVKPATRDMDELRRWEARRAEIPRAVKTAEKFAPAERKAPSITVNLGKAGSPDEPGSPGEPGQDHGLLVDLAQLQARSGTIKWQVKHVIPEDSLGMLFGASGTYKSFVALDHCLHVAHGLQWMGNKTKQGGVVYVAAEGGAGIFRRVQAWHQHKGLALAPNFHVCVTPLVLSELDHLEALASAIAALPDKPSLIYIDTLSQTFSGDENSNTDISAYLRNINALIRARFTCTVVVIHHSGHSATERPRGASSIIANVDFLAGVYKPDGTSLMARLDFIKQKDGDKAANIAFKLERIVLGHDEDGEEISSLAAEHNDVAQRLLANAAAKLSGHEQALMSLINQAGGRILDKDLRAAFYDLLGKEAIKGGKLFNQDTARQAYLRAMKSLGGKSMCSVNVASGLVLANLGPDEA